MGFLTIEDFLKLKELWENISGVLRNAHAPEPVIRAVGWFLIIAIGSTVLYFALRRVHILFKYIWSEILQPCAYTAEQKYERNRRKSFIHHLENEINRLDNQEDWSDHRFTDLEAEVETEDPGRYRLWPFTRYGTSGTYRERSLSRALNRTGSKLVVLEGGPGSGKSVALRHVARMHLRKALRSRRLAAVIPMYINLRDLKRESAHIDRNLIAEYVKQCIRRVNNRDVDAYVEDHFDEGLRNGTWFFLFDSFDELPDVLSSTEEDRAVQEYVDAISDFSSGFNSCRTVIASRKYHGPKRVINWPRFRIQPLSGKQKQSFIVRAGLPPATKSLVLSLVGSKKRTVDGDNRDMTENPMFLGLVCEYAKKHNAVPVNLMEAIDAFVEGRFSRDRMRLQQRGMQSLVLRITAERVAYCMAAEKMLGLSPTRTRLEWALKQHFPEVSSGLDAQLDGLEYLKLAHPGIDRIGEEKTFMFSHRRFQEYFASCLIRQEPTRIPARAILTDAMWREAAVVLLQSQGPELERLLSEATDIVHEMLAESKQSQPSQRNRFFWTPGLLHVLNIFQDAFAGRSDQIPLHLRSELSVAVVSAYKSLDSVDRKWALEVAGVLSEVELIPMLRSGFSEEIQDLRDVAFAQAARLRNPPVEIINSIRRTLAARGVAWLLQGDKWSTLAYVQRLKHQGLQNMLTLLLRIRTVDLLLHAFLVFVAALRLYVFHDSRAWVSIATILCSIIITIAYARMSRWATFSRSTDDRPPASLFLPSLAYLSLLRWILLLPATRVLKIPFSVLALYVIAAWAPLSYWVAADSTLSRSAVSLWTVAPLAPLIKILLHPIRTLKSILNQLHKNYKLIALLSIFCLVMLFAVRALSRITYVGPFTLSLLEGLVVLLFLTAQAVWTLRDFSRLRHWMRREESGITPESLITVLSSFRHSYFRYRLLAQIARNKIVLERLLDNVSSESFLHSCVIQIQHDRAASKAFYNNQRTSLNRFARFDIKNVRQDATGCPVFDYWYQQHCQRVKSGLSYWSPEVLNELTRLLELSRQRPRRTSVSGLASYSGAAY